MKVNQIYLGNTLKVLKEFRKDSIDCCVTSPPYWNLRDFNVEGEVWDDKQECEHEFRLEHIKQNPSMSGIVSGKTKVGQGYRNFKRGFCKKCNAWKGQLGLEPDGDLFVKHLCDIFDEVKRVLKNEGTCWVNLGDTYKKSEKSLCIVPQRFAMEMINRGWLLRNIIIWHKPNAMPCAAKDRFTVDFEYIFFFTKSKRYYFEQQKETSKEKIPRNKRCVWSICSKGIEGDHCAVYPEKLIETPLKAGCPENGIVLDPFMGSGTTALVALKQNKKYLGIELNPAYQKLAEKRIKELLR